MSSPRVSVVMPVHDAQSTLPRALASLASQTLSDWELVAIDDGSSDGSADLLAEAALRDPRVRLLRRPHRGIVAALNAGLSRARAHVIARFDADDENAPRRLELQWAFLERHPEIGLVGSGVEFVGNSATSAGYAAHVAWLNTLLKPEAIALARFVESPFAHPSVMFRRELPERFGDYREGAFPEDYELWLRWLEHGVRMSKVPEPLVRWHDAPARLSRTDPRYALDAFYRLKASYLARWLAENRPAPDVPPRRLLAWGAGRLTRRRIEYLEAEGIAVDGYIDIDPLKQGRRRDGRSVLAPEAIPGPHEVFVLGYVANRGARDLQRAHLEARGHVEGRDFLFAA